MAAHWLRMAEMWVRFTALGTIFHTFILPMTLVSMTQVSCRVGSIPKVWVLNLPSISVGCLYVSIKSIKRLTIPGGICVVGYTDLSGKGLHRQIGIVVTSESNGSILAQNGRDVGSIPTLGAIFPIFISPTTIIWGERIIIDFYWCLKKQLRQVTASADR